MKMYTNQPQMFHSTPLDHRGIAKRNQLNMSSASSPTIASLSKYQSLPSSHLVLSPSPQTYPSSSQNYSPGPRSQPGSYSPTQEHFSRVSPSRVTSSPTGVYTPSSFIRQRHPSELEKSTIQKQRKELQLLIAELQDRDRELNEMVASHQKQMLAWERDRQRLLTLEQKCTRLQGEVKNRNDQVRSLTTRLKVIQSQDQSKSCALQTTQKQLEQLSEKASMSSMQLTDLQEDNGRLNTLVQTLTTKVGQLDAREQELLTVIRLKDRDLNDATDHISELTSKFKRLEMSNKESKYSAATGKKEISDWKNRYKEMKKDAESLKLEVDKLASINLEQKVEMGKTQESLKAVERELDLSVERETRRDQLIQLQHSKQERIDAELTSLRQAYARQYRDMSLLQLNLESHREKSRDEENKENENPVVAFSPVSTPRTSKTVSPIKIEGVSPLSTPGRDGVELEQRETESVCTEEVGQEEDEDEDEAGEFSDTSEEELVDAGEGDASPTTKLHRLLSESRQMVANLEQSSLPPYADTANGLDCGNEESESMQNKDN
ncbi:coiled-coil domain-containing protein 62-like isoform X2 [Apostichopus japonicus]|uniref:coiled-coil domain-containing protein 62-like isoform X2 n=1 Tax=Stichopus japonicus TaxID=307972 RepID=UPI003AB128E5